MKATEEGPVAVEPAVAPTGGTYPNGEPQSVRDAADRRK